MSGCSRPMYRNSSARNLRDVPAATTSQGQLLTFRLTTNANAATPPPPPSTREIQLEARDQLALGVDGHCSELSGESSEGLDSYRDDESAATVTGKRKDCDSFVSDIKTINKAAISKLPSSKNNGLFSSASTSNLPNSCSTANAGSAGPRSRAQTDVIVVTRRATRTSRKQQQYYLHGKQQHDVVDDEGRSGLVRSNSGGRQQTRASQIELSSTADHTTAAGGNSRFNSWLIPKSISMYLFGRSDNIDGFGGAATSGMPCHLAARKLHLCPAREVAEELTLMDAEMLRRISPDELKNGAWMKKDLEPPSVIMQMVDCFNHLTRLISTEVLDEVLATARAKVVSSYIQVALECYNFRNYQSLKAVLSALQSTPVHRLKMTWKLVPHRKKKIFHHLCELLDEGNNFKLYRQELEMMLIKRFPCVPFLGCFLGTVARWDAYQTIKPRKKLLRGRTCHYRVLNPITLHESTTEMIVAPPDIRLSPGVIKQQSSGISGMSDLDRHNLGRLYDRLSPDLIGRRSNGTEYHKLGSSYEHLSPGLIGQTSEKHRLQTNNHLLPDSIRQEESAHEVEQFSEKSTSVPGNSGGSRGRKFGSFLVPPDNRDFPVPECHRSIVLDSVTVLSKHSMGGGGGVKKSASTEFLTTLDSSSNNSNGVVDDKPCTGDVCTCGGGIVEPSISSENLHALAYSSEGLEEFDRQLQPHQANRHHHHHGNHRRIMKRRMGSTVQRLRVALEEQSNKPTELLQRLQLNSLGCCLGMEGSGRMRLLISSLREHSEDRLYELSFEREPPSSPSSPLAPTPTNNSIVPPSSHPHGPPS